MSSNPYQRKDYPQEQLTTLRNRVRQIYIVNRGEVLQTPKNKNSPYYTFLKDDIFEKTDTSISEGTLLKFFHDDINRKYQLIVIRTIEDYVKPLTTDASNEKDLSVSDSVNIKLQDKTGEEIKMFAKRLYVELTTRKAAIPIDEDNDVIEEIYNSWYKLFCVIREEIKILPVSCFAKQDNPVIIIDLTKKILNEVLRPHLTEHQAKFRSWLEKTKQSSEYKNFAPQKFQKKYPDYKNLMRSMKSTNEMIIDMAEELLQLIH
jgi:hypothetical protein